MVTFLAGGDARGSDGLDRVGDMVDKDMDSSSSWNCEAMMAVRGGRVTQTE